MVRATAAAAPISTATYTATLESATQLTIYNLVPCLQVNHDVGLWSSKVGLSWWCSRAKSEKKYFSMCAVF